MTETMRDEMWRDESAPADRRVADLMGRLTLEEKLGQLSSYWAGTVDGPTVAPNQDQFDIAPQQPLGELAAAGLGQLTRVFGTEPITPGEGIARLRRLQDAVVAGSRFGIPAMVHEECLTGLMMWTATVFPGPLAWGAAFDPALVREMSVAIGAGLRALGVHQGLAPVMDVTRDYRWGRTEETIGEDPYLVGTVGAAYVRGLEDSGVMATLKHFAGYSASVSGRNMAPVSMGRREFADVILEPFEFALRAGGARAVMAAYPDMDGVPSHADEGLLTELLRDRLGFAGLVVSDYYAVSFLETQHGVAESPGEAAALALRAGVDMELPAARCYGAPLLAAVRSGTVPEALIDRAAERVLRMKCELGLLDGAAATSPADSESPDLDPPANRELARRLAEEAVVLVANGAGTLPLRPASSIAVVGPVAAAPRSMIGCYSFPNHILPAYPELPMGVEITTVADAVAAEFPRATVAVAAAGDITAGPDADARSGLDAAVAAARAAEVCVLVVGDRPGIFGGGTSGEGCDAVTLDLPGGQAELAAAVLATGTPTVLVLMSGRPYALGGLSERAAAVVVAFLPGQEGGAAVAGVLSGRVEPSGRLPVSIPRGEAVRPGTYLRSRMAKATSNSSVDPTLLYPFGHGLTWTRFAYSGLTVSPAAVPTSGSVDITAVVRNAGERSGTEVVQLYLSDPVASVVRPERWLAGYTRVRLEPGEAARVTFTVHADRTSFSGADLRRIVEPGVIDVRVGSSSEDLPLRGSFVLEGSARTVGADRVLDVPVRVGPV